MSSLFVKDESDDEKEIEVKAEQSDEMDVDLSLIHISEPTRH